MHEPSDEVGFAHTADLACKRGHSEVTGDWQSSSLLSPRPSCFLSTLHPPAFYPPSILLLSIHPSLPAFYPPSILLLSIHPPSSCFLSTLLPPAFYPPSSLLASIHPQSSSDHFSPPLFPILSFLMSIPSPPPSYFVRPQSSPACIVSTPSPSFFVRFPLHFSIYGC